MEQKQAPPNFEPKKMEPPEAPRDEMLLTRRIHIMGKGSIGTLIAHSLRVMPHPPPITLMFHRPEAFEKFKLQGGVIRLIDPKGDVNDEQDGFDTEVRRPPPTPRWDYRPAYKQSNDAKKLEPESPLQQGELLPSGEIYIHCLILAVKAQVSVAALRSIKHRVDSRSTICLMQNGLGQIDEVVEQVFPDPATRPTFLIGVISHGCYKTGSNTVVHAGFGVTSLGIYRDQDKYPLPPKSFISDPSVLSQPDRRKYYPTDAEMYDSSLSACYLLRTLTRSTVLCCAAYPYLDLFMLQLEKLSSNALLNPLTAVYDVQNGYTIRNSHLSIVQNLLLAEISLVIRSLPELQPVPAINQRFSAQRLKSMFTSVADKTAKNSSSMREDMRMGKPNTEIDYINGYIVKRGQELGIQCALNFMLVQMVKAKTGFRLDEERGAIPFMASKVQGQVDWDKVGQEGGVVLDDVGTAMRRETEGDGI